MNSDIPEEPDDAFIPSDSSSSSDSNTPKTVRSEDLLHGCRELRIEHGEDMYYLRLTNSGKLYLTK